ncbi:MAG: hypothetical protein JOZ02_18235 [Acidobacteria bacterium]|nr:hypothetical protein [Acidobacteriota bacterium]
MKFYRTYARRGLLAAAFSLLALTPFTARAQKMTPEELVAKHLAAVGTSEARAAVKSRLMAGRVTVTLRGGGSGQNTGLSLLFSKGDKSVIAMSFRNPNYPQDKFGFDGQNVTISYVKPGIRSEIGDFIKQRDQLLRLGLMGGVLSTGWVLASPDLKGGKLEFAGTGKVNDKPVYKLRYTPRKGSDLKITLFFDQETFRHVRTEYEQVVSARTGPAAAVVSGSPTRPGQAPQTASASDASKEFQRELRLKMFEEFSDFKEVGGLTLPQTYKIILDLDRQQGGKFQADWLINLEKFDFNQDLKDEWFDVTSAGN